MPIPFTYILQGLILVALPLCFLAWIVVFRPRSLLDLIAKGLLVGAFIAFFFLAGRWDIVGVCWRYFWLTAFAAIFIIALFRFPGMRTLPDWTLRSAAPLAINIIIALFFITSIWQIRGNAIYQGSPVNLTFPLKNTSWYITNGGGSPAMNHHTSVRAQRYALDVSGLNGAGMRAWGLLPKDLDAYAIFGEAVTAPCAGDVLSIENDMPDLIPPDRDRSNLAGNFVLMRCDGVAIVLAHLRQGSVKVQAGDLVQTGQALGQVGNSGNTTEPHLHIHAVGDMPGDTDGLTDDILFTGKPVPMLFDGRFLTRNAWGRV